MHSLLLGPLRRALRWFVGPSACLLILGLCGCTGGHATHPYSIALGGRPDHGRQLIQHYNCGQCHTIPGVSRAHGVFGPPLNFMASRSMIAGNFPNTPDNLVRWIMSPKSMKPATAMPDLGIDQQQARDIAAYLETLQSAP